MWQREIPGRSCSSFGCRLGMLLSNVECQLGESEDGEEDPPYLLR